MLKGIFIKAGIFMGLLTIFDLSLLILLFLLFVYVFVTVSITGLHKVYLMFHFLMMLWPFCQFATDINKNPQYQLFFVLLSFVALSLLGSGWLLLTFFLTGYAHLLNRKNLFMLFVPSAVSAIGVITNPFHSFVNPLHKQYIQRTYGPWFWLTIVILLCYFFVSLFFIYRTLRSPKTGPAIKKQVNVTLWGIIVLASFALMDLFLNVVLKRWLPIIPGLTSAGILFSDLIFVFAIKRYKLLDIVTIAHKDVIDTIPYGILVLDENETIIELNPALHSYVGLKVHDQFDMSLFLKSVHTEGDRELFLKSYANKQDSCSQIEIILDECKPNHFLLQCSPIMFHGHTPIGRTITFQDVTKLRYLVSQMNHKNEVLRQRNLSLMSVQDQLFKANKALNEMANTDSLTRCFNRRYLTNILTNEVTNIRNKVPFSLILFDIDYFKTINDRYGHLIGDEVLCSTVNTVKQLLLPTDFLARYGGEEFMIYLPNSNNHRALYIAEQVRSVINANQIRIEQCITPISITISLGVLTIDVTDESVENPEGYLIDILSVLDKSLYQAKQNGRNRVENVNLKGQFVTNT
jgi:two-component system, cell cycle response regulator